MSRLEEIKNEVAKEYDYSDFNSSTYYGATDIRILDEVAKRYAREVAQASLEKAAEVVSRNYNDSYECKQDILNPKNITLL
ncbi:hypothetical protein [Elizabethkingia anophelis]|uniref:hypothetical protein n=1 Tax=Elizabethkingia anophelis TaxID=1117645 RepID=UPI0016288F3B|nr:hypothetical protein [Elizabethkingia anophelis]